jgi:hypothetical protein
VSLIFELLGALIRCLAVTHSKLSPYLQLLSRNGRLWSIQKVYHRKQPYQCRAAMRGRPFCTGVGDCQQIIDRQQLCWCLQPRSRTFLSGMKSGRRSELEVRHQSLAAAVCIELSCELYVDPTILCTHLQGLLWSSVAGTS